MDIIHPFTFEILASELPESLIARLPARPAANARYVVEISPADSDEEKFQAIKSGVEEGLADSESGRTYTSSEVLDWLKKEVFPT